jgi:flagellar biosynthesis/type III secretory pathway protein FliH
MVSAHREAIARLSVEIAAKVLARKVGEKDYEIESIIAEALKSAPTRQDIVVRLNPGDYEAVQEAASAKDTFGSIAFVADQSIGRAECVVETPKGTIESMIDGHLEHVCRVLQNTG